MPKINTIATVSVPKLSDKLVGTSVGGAPINQTNNFTLQQLKTLFEGGSPPSSPNLQSVLNAGNTATQSIFLTGTMQATNLAIANNATSKNLYLSERFFDKNNSQGTNGQYLTSTGTGVQWSTLTIAIPTLQQVLTAGNVSDKNIITTGNIQAANLQSSNLTANSNLRVVGTFSDSSNASGTSNQVLSSTVVGTSWVDLPSYSAVSPLIYNNTLKQFSIQQVTGTQNGYLSSADWITFNGKQNAGNYITALTGEATASGPGSASITLNNLAVINKTLTGFTTLSGTVTSADSIVTAFGKLQNQINGVASGLNYQGAWNASTNVPTLVSGVGTNGEYYVVDVAGNTNLNGITDWKIGDWAIFNGTSWQKIDNTDSVVSVNGQIGVVVLNSDNIAEGSTNLYYTDTRARNSISSLATGLTYTAGTGVFSLTAGYSIPTIANQTDWTTAYNNSIVSAAVTGTTTKTLTLNQQDGGTITANWTEPDLTGFVPYTGANQAVVLGYNSLNASILRIDGPSAPQGGYLGFKQSNNVIAGEGSYTSIYAFGSGYLGFKFPQSPTGYKDFKFDVSTITTDVPGGRIYSMPDADGTLALTSDIPPAGLTSVGLSMPSAFSVANSPLTSNGTIAITGSGTSLQYIDGTGALQNFPAITGYVPYTGANQNVNLGEYGLTTGFLRFDLTPTGTPTTVGTMYWDSFYRTPSVVTGTGATTLQVGQEEVLLVHNNTGSPLTDGQVVYVTGSTGELPSVSLADASSESTSAATLGVVTESIANGADGFVTVSGIVHGINTLAYNEGDILWLSETAGQFTTVKPVSPAHLVLIGYVIKKAGGNGSILVKIQNTQELEESSDVLISAPKIDGQGLFLQTVSGTQLWRNRSISDVLGYTPANAARTISTTAPLQGGGDLSANRTFSITQSGIASDGYLSSTDWNTFNSKQNTITLTTTGSSGPATLIGNTLNIPDYVTDLSGYVTLGTTQTLTGLKTILRGGDVLNFKIGTDTLYGLKIAYNQNELVPSGEATWSFESTFNNGSGTGITTTPISFFRGVLVTGERLLSSSVNANLLDYYGNNPTGRYPIYAYNTGVQQFASSIIVGETAGVVNAVTGAIADLPSGVVANFKGRVIGSNAVNSNEFVTLSQIPAPSTSIMIAGTGACSTIRDGVSNVSSGSYSFAGGGQCNTASGSCAFVGGGKQNTASGTYSFVGGGGGPFGGNSATSDFSTVSGGYNNTASGYESFIGGGHTNIACGGVSVISGGFNNRACGIKSAVVGGEYNTASGYASFIGSGRFNVSSGCASTVSGGYGNNACGNCSTVGGGSNNTALVANSTVGGGVNNNANAVCSTISGGVDNTANGIKSFVGGGQENTASGYKSFVGGGGNNTVISSYSTISGGYRNINCGCFSFIGGGQCSAVAFGQVNSAILGGFCNSIAHSDSFIVGSNITSNRACTTFVNDLTIVSAASCSGCGVCVSTNGLLVPYTLSGGGIIVVGTGTNSTMRCGVGNTASGYGSVSLGRSNLSCGNSSTVSGGVSNCAKGNWSTVAGGASNNACGLFSTISGGGGCFSFAANTASASYSTIGGGSGNTASGSFSTLGGGNSNTVGGDSSTVSGGFNNFTTFYSFTGNCATVSGGNLNVAAANLAAIGGGYSNTVLGVSSVIGGGTSNNISETACCSTISGGYRNCICNVPFSFVGGGNANCANGCFSTVSGGYCNLALGYGSFVGGGSGGSVTFVDRGNLACGDYSVVTGGFNNTAYCCSSTISGGTCNIVNGPWSTIGGGRLNRTGSGEYYSTVSGGYNNVACNYGSFVGAGRCNTASGYGGNVIVGGANNTTSSFYSFVGGGAVNCSINQYTFVGGGWGNVANGPFSLVVAGTFNTSSAYRSIVVGGNLNTASGYYATVVGGWQNTASGSRSFIGGGRFNTVSSYYSGILGGVNNTVSHYDSFIVGTNLSSSASCTTYVNALSKTSGTFRINHPDPTKTATHYLQHSFVESPTRGDNIYRYKITTCNCSASLELPDYYKFLNEDDQVFVTPKGHFGSAYGVIDSCQNSVNFVSNADGEYNVLIIGTRKDIDAKNGFNGVEILKKL